MPLSRTRFLIVVNTMQKTAVAQLCHDAIQSFFHDIQNWSIAIDSSPHDRNINELKAAIAEGLQFETCSEKIHSSTRMNRLEYHWVLLIGFYLSYRSKVTWWMLGFDFLDKNGIACLVVCRRPHKIQII